ncbi:MAG: CHASE2 domain-containing protein [Verrucomicrobia bacterium]|nr:CHASE2 domain-containing protein [Verrucomicrobiota bacterium]
MDFLFAARHCYPGVSKKPQEDVTVVFVDTPATEDSNPYIELLEKLADGGVRAVVFDIVFDSKVWSNPSVLQRLSRAVSNATEHANMKIVFGAEGYQKPDQNAERPPAEGIQNIVKQFSQDTRIGVVNLEIHTADKVVRRHSSDNGFQDDPLVIAVAKLLKQEVYDYTNWVNYYGPAGTLTKIEARTILAERDELRLALEDKVVFVGEHAEPDLHKTPFTRIGYPESSGVEIHATAYSNLVKANWITDFPIPEGWQIVFLGAFFGLFFTWLTPRLAFRLAICGFLLVGLMSFLLFKHANLVSPWLLLGATQVLTAFVSFIPVKNAFISYRGEDGTCHAALIKEKLERIGIEVFIDLKGDQSGKARDALIPEVRRRRNLVLIVTHGVIDKSGPDDFIGKEVKAARNVVPVYLPGVRAYFLAELKNGKQLHQSLEKALKEQIWLEFHIDQADACTASLARKLRRGVREFAAL